MASSRSASFRVGRVRADRRNQVWYLCYHEHGQRRRPRVGPDRDAARAAAAQVNAQLECDAPTALSFEPISIADLRQRWLDHHEYVRRSAPATVARYRTATKYLVDFADGRPGMKLVSSFRARDAEQFVRHLRTAEVAPNGHEHARKRRLHDKGLKFILTTCRSMVRYAERHRHLPPYAENPFAALEIHRIPIEDAKPIVVFTPDEERRFLEACDDWQFPLFLTLMLTGLRPGELTHLLLPDDLDLERGVLRVRNKGELGWQVKTRSERDVPLCPALLDVLHVYLAGRGRGPVFLRRRFDATVLPTRAEMAARMTAAAALREQQAGRPLSRAERGSIFRSRWRRVGALREDKVREEFMRVTHRIGLTSVTMPKVLRHLFATWLQEGNVDPLIRNQLMGHAARSQSGPGFGLGMTAVYTHSRYETIRAQLIAAMDPRPAITIAREWLEARLASLPAKAPELRHLESELN